MELARVPKMYIVNYIHISRRGERSVYPVFSGELGVCYATRMQNPGGVHPFIIRFVNKGNSSTPLRLGIIPAHLTPGRVQLPSATALNRGLFIGKPSWGSHGEGLPFLPDLCHKGEPYVSISI